MHYEEAVFLQILKRKGDTSRASLVDSFLDAFPYGAELFGMSQDEYEHHIDKHSFKLVEEVKQYGISVFSNDN